jgi:hypothetical protein
MARGARTVKWAGAWTMRQCGIAALAHARSRRPQGEGRRR